MKRTLVLAGLLLAGAASAQQMKNPDTLVVATIGDWGSGFDPAYCYDTACGNVLNNTVETLYGYEGNDASKAVPLLAAGEPEYSNGGKTVTVKLRPGLKFSDGTPVTAEDVEYSLERQMVLSTDLGAASLLNEPLLGRADLVRAKSDPNGYAKINKAIETKGKDTVVFNLPKAFGAFPQVLAFQSFGIVSKNAAVKAGDWSGTEKDWVKFNNLAPEDSKWTNTGMLATGPFVIERYEPAKTLVLKRNANYWRAPSKLARVIEQAVEDDTARIQLLRTGDVDMLTRDGLSNALLGQVRQIKTVDVKTTPGLNLSGFFFTHKIDGTGTNYLGSGKLDGKGIPADFFSDLNVRKAFAAAFDYDAFINDVMQGLADQQNTVNIKGLAGYSAASPKFAMNRSAAISYFRKAHDGKVWQNGFTLPVFFNSGNTSRQRGLEILKRNVESLNPKFKLDVRELQFGQILAQASEHKMPFWMGGWSADYADAHNFAQPYLHSDGNYPLNQVYRSGQLDKLINEAIAENRFSKRAALYREVARQEAVEVPNIPFFQRQNVYINHNWVKNRAFNPILSSDYYYPMSKGN